MTYAEMKRHRGRFLIDMFHFQDDPDWARKILSEVVVMRAEQRWDMDAIEYTGSSELFDPVEKFEMTPVYTCSVWKGVTAAFDEVRFERVPE